MRIPLYQIDAFTDRVFSGNPAAICPLEGTADWPADALLQSIAVENNLSETAFLLAGRDPVPLRWFTPEMEVDLCGHATLAAACVLFRFLEPGRREVVFSSRSGPLPVTAEGDLLALDFPARPGEPVPAPPPALLEGLGGQPLEVRRARDFLVAYATAAEVRALRPDMTLLAGLDALGVIATAPGDAEEGGGPDFVSRFFAPGAGIPEDPVTGSAHCTLVPYWAERLGRTKLHARQVSPRGGELWCEARGDRVRIAGRAVCYLRGEIELDG